ncbi:MAG: CPBP family intramembrane metalloprotease [Elusimicrobia bacterium]|nr:CPBP family intramembrane metalloprotease [Elusimicrobiota bacterium]
MTELKNKTNEPGAGSSSSALVHILGVLLVFCVYRVFQELSQNLLFRFCHYLTYAGKIDADKANLIGAAVVGSILWGCGAVLLVMCGLKLYKLSPEDIGWRKSGHGNFRKVLAGVIGAPVCCFLFRIFVVYMRYKHLPDLSLKAPVFATLTSYYSVITAAGTGALIEELFFRGLIQTALERKINFKYSLIITAVLFTLTHSYKIHDWYIVLIFIVQGLLYGLLKKWDGSLWSSTVAHGFFNFCLRWFPTI